MPFDDMNRDVTSSNATLVLTVEDLFPQGITLEMFGTDQAWSSDAVDIAETRMGVDGRLVAGYTPAIHSVTITLEAASPSRTSLTTLWEAMQTNRKIYACTLVATLPAISETITWSNGCLKNAAPVPAGAKTLQPTTWQFDFETVERTSI